MSDPTTLDLRGLKCPLPVIRSRKATKRLQAGTTLRIECTDPLSCIDIPHMCNSDGHQLLASGEDGATLWFELRLKGQPM